MLVYNLRKKDETSISLGVPSVFFLPHVIREAEETEHREFIVSITSVYPKSLQRRST
jgi:hypothetical protein